MKTDCIIGPCREPAVVVVTASKSANVPGVGWRTAAACAEHAERVALWAVQPFPTRVVDFGGAA